MSTSATDGAGQPQKRREPTVCPECTGTGRIGGPGSPLCQKCAGTGYRGSTPPGLDQRTLGRVLPEDREDALAEGWLAVAEGRDAAQAVDAFRKREARDRRRHVRGVNPYSDSHLAGADRRRRSETDSSGWRDSAGPPPEHYRGRCSAGYQTGVPVGEPARNGLCRLCGGPHRIAGGRFESVDDPLYCGPIGHAIEIPDGHGVKRRINGAVLCYDCWLLLWKTARHICTTRLERALDALSAGRTQKEAADAAGIPVRRLRAILARLRTEPDTIPDAVSTAP